MEVRAELRQLRISPRKVRLVAGLLKGMDVGRAKYQLDSVVKKSSGPMLKLLNSAIANATNNFNLEEANLFVKEINVDEGVKLKRFRPKGFGRTSPIEKKTSHIRIVLDERVPGMKTKKKDKKEVQSVEALDTKPTQFTKAFEPKKPEIQKVIRPRGLMSKLGGASKRLFRRKTV